MNGKNLCEDNGCLSEEVIARILAGEELVGELDAQTSEHLETCGRCRDVLDQRSAEALAGLPQRLKELEAGDAEKVDAMVRKLMDSERRGELDVHDQSIREHLEQGNVEYRFGDYDVVRFIARGGMGSVFEARDRTLGNRSCVVKLINSGVYATTDEIRRFMNETQAAALLDHPSIVKVWRAGCHAESGGPSRHFVVMEYVRGESLESKIKSDEKIGVRQAAIWARQIAEGLAHAHLDQLPGKHNANSDSGTSNDPPRRGRIFHRDIKPANILIDEDGNAKIIDFGLAKHEVVSEALTRAGALIGTPAYTSPEQSSEGLKYVGPGPDIFSLGVVLYELLTGQRPFQGRTWLETINLVHNEEPKSPRKFNRDVSTDLETICLKCLQKKPEDRYASAQALSEDLRRFLANEPLLASPPGVVVRIKKWVQRYPWAALLMSALALVSIASVCLFSLERNATKQANLAKSDAVEAKRKTDFENYVGLIQLAESEYRNNNLMGTSQYLSQTNPEFRDIEWHLLNNLCHQEEKAIQHEFKCSFISWSPDSSEILTLSMHAGNSSYLTIWDADGWRMKSRVKIDEMAAVSVNWPTSEVAYTYKLKNQVKVVNFRTGEETRNLEEAKINGEVSTVSISPDGQWLVATANDRGVIWSLDSGKITGEWTGEVEQYRKLIFCPNSQQFVTLASSTNEDEKLVVRELPTCKIVRVLKGHEGQRMPNVGCFNSDGTILVTGTYIDPRVAQREEIILWDFASGQPLQKMELHKFGITSVDFHPDGKHLMTAGLDKIVKILELDNENNIQIEKTRSFIGHGRFAMARFEAKGKRFATVENDNAVRIWDYSRNQGPLRILGHPNSGVFSVAVSPDNRSIATSGSYGLVNIIDLKSGEIHKSFCGTEDHEDFVAHSLEFSRDGKQLVAGGMGILRQGCIVDSSSAKEIATLVGHTRNEGESLPFSGQPPASHQATHIRSVAYHPSQDLLFTAGHGEPIRIWNAVTGAFQENWDVQFDQESGSSDKFRQLCFSKDGRVGVVSYGGSAKVYDSKRERVCFELPGGPDYLCIAFSKDPAGSLLAAANFQSQIRVFDSGTGNEVSVLNGHEATVTSIEFAKNGKRIITTSNDCTVRIWDVATGKMLLRLADHPGAVMMAKLTPDQTHMVTVGWANTTFVWDISQAEIGSVSN